MPSIEARTAVRTSIALFLTALIAFALHLPSPYWSCMTVIIVNRIYYSELIAKSVMRLLGTLCGAIIGFSLAPAIANDFVTFIVVNFMIICIGFYGWRRSNYPYAYLLAMITIFLINAEIVIAPNNVFYIAIWRPAEISLGIIISTLCSLVIFPNKGQAKLHQLLKEHAEQLILISQALTQLKDENPTLYYISTARKLISQCKELLTSLSFEASEKQLTQLRQRCDFQHQLMLQLIELYDNYQGELSKSTPLWQAINIAPVFAALSTAIEKKLTVDEIIKVTPCLQSMEEKLITLRKNNKLQVYPNAVLFQLHRTINTIKSIAQLLQQHQVSEYLPKIKRLDADPDVIKQSIKAGLTGILALLFWMLSNWPSGIQGIISSLVISMQRNVEDMNVISIQRFAGCLLGGTIALLLLRFFYFDLAIIIMALLLFGGLFHYLFFKVKNNNYVFFQANLAFIITLVQFGGPPISLAPPLQRLAGIFIGILASTLVANAFWRHTLQSYTIDRIRKLYQLVLKNLELTANNSTKFHNVSPLIKLIRSYFEKLPDTIKNSNYLNLFNQLIRMQRLVKFRNFNLDQTLIANGAKIQCDVAHYRDELINLLNEHSNNPITYLTSDKRLSLSDSLEQALHDLKNSQPSNQLNSSAINQLVNFLASIKACVTISSRDLSIT